MQLRRAANGRGQAITGKMSQQGVSLIEVLVSIVIASIGLLALAGVNATALRMTKLTQYRSTATLLVRDMSERMRANKEGFEAGAYDQALSFSAQASAPTLSSSELCDQIVSSCTSSQIANLDLKLWRITVRNQLPDGSIYIQRATAQDSADVWIAWRDPVVANTDEAPVLAGECPGGLSLATGSGVRCSYFRVAL